MNKVSPEYLPKRDPNLEIAEEISRRYDAEFEAMDNNDYETAERLHKSLDAFLVEIKPLNLGAQKQILSHLENQIEKASEMRNDNLAKILGKIREAVMKEISLINEAEFLTRSKILNDEINKNAV